MKATRKILVPVSFSEHSETDLKKAMDIACQTQAKLFVLNVIDKKILRSLMESGMPENETIDMLVAMRLRYAQDMVRKQVQAYPPASQIEIDISIKIGHPPDVILQAQREEGIDLLVIGSSKKGGILRKLIGSVAETVIRNTTLPVRVVEC